MWETCTPSEGGKSAVDGKTRLQAVLGTVRLLLTFGRWEKHGGRENTATGGSRDGAASAHLRKVCGKCEKYAHLRKVGGSEKAGGMICRRGVVEKTVGLGK